MTPEELAKLNQWYDSKEDSFTEHYDYEYAFEHFGELLDHITELESKLDKLRKVEKAASALVETSWASSDYDTTGHVEISFYMSKSAWRALKCALEEE